MKKKVLLLIAAIGIIISVFAFSGCSGGKDASGQSLTLNKKYIYYGDTASAAECRSYYIFLNEKSGEHNYYYSYDYLDIESGMTKRIRSYKIKFTYLIIEDTVICFYDSVTYAPDHNDIQGIETTWNSALGFSEDVLMTATTVLYICENYLADIPNFGK